MEKIEFQWGFSLEDITDSSMGLIQNSCWSNAPTSIDIYDLLEKELVLVLDKKDESNNYWFLNNWEELLSRFK